MLLWMLLILLLCLLFYMTFVLPTRWLKVERIELPIGAGVKIVQLSDLHVERNRIAVDLLERTILAEKPDMICLTGDFLDERASFIKLVPYLRMIQRTGIQAFSVLGNHDYFLQYPHELRQLLQEFGIRVLENESILLDNLNLVGLDDYCSGHSDEVKGFKSVVPDVPTVVMTHDPTITLTMEHHFDYLFAGHLHGKQFNVPFLFKLKKMGPLAASGVYKGLHQCDKGRFYISKGIGQSGFNFRFLVRSEITVHEL